MMNQIRAHQSDRDDHQPIEDASASRILMTTEHRYGDQERNDTEVTVVNSQAKCQRAKERRLRGRSETNAEADGDRQQLQHRGQRQTNRQDLKRGK